MTSSVETVSHALLTAGLLAAVAFDLHSRRVPNRLVLSGLAVALVLHMLALSSGKSSLSGSVWWSPLAGLCLGFTLMLPLYLLRAMGAGDLKLMAMVGAFIGPGAVATACLYTLIAGGLLSLAFMFGRGVAAQTLSNIRLLLTDWAVRAGSGQGARPPPLQTTAARLPYAVAITLGTAAALIWPLGAP